METKKTLRRLKSIIIVTALIMVSSAFAQHNVASAAAKASYTVRAGFGSEIGIDILAFAPQTVKVHRGDTITWQFAPIHTVHFAAKPLDLVVVSDIDGKQIPEVNPAILTPSGQSGDPLKEGFQTGLIGDPGAPTAFSLTMDVAPGTYAYLCDLHAGMVGTIVVVDDSEKIGTPEDVTKEGDDYIAGVLGSAEITALKAYDTANLPSKEAQVSISAGFTEQTGSINRYFPATA